MIAAAFTDVMFTPTNGATTAITAPMRAHVLPVCKDLTYTAAAFHDLQKLLHNTSLSCLQITLKFDS